MILDSRDGEDQASCQSPQLAALTNELIQKLEAGGEFDLEAFVQQHPEAADELRKLYPTIRDMVALGQTSTGEESLLDARQDSVSGILGDYRIIREVGRGGMGVVYEAEQLSLGRRVALKILPLAAVLDPRSLQRFKTEAQAAAQLHHHNIVPIHGVGSERSVHFYAMQFIEGRTLAEVIGDLRTAAESNAGRKSDGAPLAMRVFGRESGRAARATDQAQDTDGAVTVRDWQAAISTERSARGTDFFRKVSELGIQIARALEHAHQQGVVHRDIKPSNLILDAQGKVWVTDFGLARIEGESSMTMTGDMIGTLRYMSPEQALAKRVSVDERTDIYSLGATLYELFTTRPAYDGADRQKLLQQIVFEDPRAPSKVNRAVPRELETIVLKAMAKAPHERYDTAAGLADDLQRFLDDRPILARRPTLLQRAGKYVRRHRLVMTTLGITTAFMMIMLTAMSIVMAARERGNRVAMERVKNQTEENANRLARQLAFEHLEDAQNWCDKGRIATGLLWMARSLQVAPPDDEALRRCIRANLSTYSRSMHQLRSVLVHDAQVVAIGYSPDGTLVATGSSKGRLQLWRAANGRPVGKPLEHGDAVTALAFSADGTQLLTGTQGGVTQLWDIPTGKAIGSPGTHDGPVVAVLHREEALRVLVQSGETVLRMKDGRTNQQIGASLVHPARVNDAALSSDGKWVLTGCEDMAVRLWDAETGDAIGRPLVEPNNRASPSKITAVTFSRDGTKFAAAAEASWVRFWKTKTQLPAGWTWIPAVAEDLAFSPDGRQLLTGFYGGILQAVNDEDDQNNQIGQDLAHRQRESVVSFSPNGLDAVTGNADGTARIWRLTNPAAPLRTFPLPGKQARAIAMSADGTRLVRAVDRAVEILDVASGTRVGDVLDHASMVASVAISPDGTRILVGGVHGSVHVWDTDTREQIAELKQHTRRVMSVSYRPDGTRFLTASYDMTARQWDASTLQPIGKPIQHEGGLYAARYSPDGTRLVTLPWGQSARLWKADGSAVAQLTTRGGEPVCTAFSPDGNRLVTGHRDRIVRVWDAHTGEPIGKPLWHVDPKPITGVAFTPDGYLMTANGRAHLWDPSIGARIGPPLELADPILRVAVSRDGAHIVAHCRDGETAIWNAPTLFDSNHTERYVLWAQVITGMELNLDGGEVRIIDGPTWHRRQERLAQLGGPSGE